MKNLFLLIFFVSVLFVFPMNSEAQKKTDPVVYFKSNMHCDDCENVLFEHLRFEKGVKDLKLDHVSNTIKIVYTEKRTGEEILKNAVIKKGYEAETINEQEYLKILGNEVKTPHKGTGSHQH